jgi:nitroimidazol reductase NimA-like FMN-containing flavoprotein (pyridoxamine 5'-phosphate oxidase superfamily)
MNLRRCMRAHREDHVVCNAKSYQATIGWRARNGTHWLRAVTGGADWPNGSRRSAACVHTSSAKGHFRANVEREPRICFEIDEPDQVFDYGRFECDSGLAYKSVILFGKIRIAEDRAVKQRFCEALMEKYGKPDTGRPKGFFSRIDMITVYAISVERMTGKEMALPALSEQWPAKDRTKTPNARP